MVISKILSRFLFRRFFAGVGLVLLIVCGIIYAVTFVERLPSNPDIFATLNDAWIRLVEYVPLNVLAQTPLFCEWRNLDTVDMPRKVDLCPC